MLKINYTQQYKLRKILIVFLFMLNINYNRQYQLGKLLIVFWFCWTLITLGSIS